MSTPDNKMLGLARLRAARSLAKVVVEHLEAVVDERPVERHLAVAVKALRSIAHCSSTDTRSRGIAQAAIEKIERGLT